MPEHVPVNSEQVEVQHPQTQQWKLVQPLDNTLVVNLGDMAARWTNDAYKSTKHREYNQNAETIRNFEAPVECILTGNGSLSLLWDGNDDDIDNAGKEDECDEENNGDIPKYEPTTAGAYIMEQKIYIS